MIESKANFGIEREIEVDKINSAIEDAINSSIQLRVKKIKELLSGIVNT
jgi:hypothetical protein